MNAVHASNTMHLPKPGECARFWPESFGIFLWCGELIVPGEDYCADHLVALVEIRDQLDSDRAETALTKETEPR